MTVQINSFERGDALVCAISGRFGFSMYEPFAAMLARFSASKVGGIEFDLSQLTFVDTVALSMLQVARDEAHRLGRRFEVSGATAEIASALSLADRVAGIVACAPPDVLLLTDIPPDTDFLKDCAALGVAASAFGSPVAAGQVTIRYGAANAGDVEAGLAKPYSGFFEKGDDGITGIGARCIEAVRNNGIALSVLTATAFSVELAQVFEHAIRQRYPLGKRASDELISLCLAEAVSNAVIHGNLGIASGMRATREGFVQFRKAMNERLADPERAQRRVEISVQSFGPRTFSIAVSDRGEGFDLAAQQINAVNTGEKQGRGLSLIRQSALAVATADEGRTIMMSF